MKINQRLKNINLEYLLRGGFKIIIKEESKMRWIFKSEFVKGAVLVLSLAYNNIHVYLFIFSLFYNSFCFPVIFAASEIYFFTSPEKLEEFQDLNTL